VRVPAAALNVEGAQIRPDLRTGEKGRGAERGVGLLTADSYLRGGIDGVHAVGGSQPNAAVDPIGLRALRSAEEGARTLETARGGGTDGFANARG
jgi:hypothetical protein